ncbi:MAG TPA: MerR family transcriptional regulator, partial [Nitrospiraceae bacterium]|nr:MerR family transcriptional regulator [Nitrospiraceae bacterium]
MNGDYSLADLCRILRLSSSRLRSCLRAALLSERSTRYSYQQLVILRTAKGLHTAGVSMRQIRKVLDSLQR